jgi:3-hydroxybutyryl-CoA dehydrogenase
VEAGHAPAELTDSGDWREDIDLLSHRYMLEDTAIGLSFLTSVGRWAGQPMPIAEGMLAIASTITGTDLYGNGRTFENLGLNGLTRGSATRPAAKRPGPETMNNRGILVVGAGRMGRGIALSYALAGIDVVLVNLKHRSTAEFEELVISINQGIRYDLEFMVDRGYLGQDKIKTTLDLVATVQGSGENHRFDPSEIATEIIYEALPETLELKREAFDWINRHVEKQTVIASTTSTLNVDELAEFVDQPGRFVNAHWLNPAHLMPLVEIAVGTHSEEAAFQRVHSSLTRVGKVPVRCTASAGYIVPRIQALAMNEAARLVEEGVASAAEVDKAVRVGFGLRFAVLGLLEFIDWGGNDILYHASRHLSRTVDENRYRVPEIVRDNMHSGRNGIREKIGFYDYQDMDIDAYRRERLIRLVELIEQMNLLPAGLTRQP